MNVCRASCLPALCVLYTMTAASCNVNVILLCPGEEGEGGFEDGVAADDAEIGGAVGDVGRDVRSLGEEEAYFHLLVGEDQLSGVAVIGARRGDADLFKELKCRFRETPLGEGDRQIAHGSSLLPPALAGQGVHQVINGKSHADRRGVLPEVAEQVVVAPALGDGLSRAVGEGGEDHARVVVELAEKSEVVGDVSLHAGPGDPLFDLPKAVDGGRRPVIYGVGGRPVQHLAAPEELRQHDEGLAEGGRRLLRLEQLVHSEKVLI